MIVGYARTSSLEQVAGFEAQLRELQEAGVEEMYREQVSSVAERKELETALRFVRRGDVFVVTKLDRLARSVLDLCRIITRLEEKQVTLRILNLGVDTGTPTGRLVVQLLGSIAEFERTMMLERQREGIAKAKSEGKYKGRYPKARNQAAVMRARFEAGESKASIARSLGVGVRSVYRMVKEG